MILNAEFKEVNHTLTADFGKVMICADAETYAKAYKAGQISMLENSKYMNANENGSVVVVNNVSPIEHDLKVKIKQPSADNLLTAPYSVLYTNDMGIEYTINSASLSVNGIASGSLNGVPIGQFETLAPTFEEGKTYYTGLIYLKGDVSSNPLSIGFYCSGGINSQYGVNEMVWDSAFNSNFLVIMAQEGINYDCEVIPIVSTEPIGSGDIDLTTISVSRYGKNLIPYPYSDTTKTINGITFTDNGDGTITVNGTATGLVDFVLCDNFLVKKGMHISGFPEIVDSNSTTGEVQVYLSSQYYLTTSKNYTKAIAVEDFPSATAIKLRIRSGYTADNLTIKPQIELNAIATKYEPYKEPQTVKANSDGTVEGIETLPNMTLIPDNQNVILECQYLRDIDTFIDDLMISIALTGGE